MTPSKNWVKLPSQWVIDDRLLEFTIHELAHNTAALMVLVVIAHHTDEETGIAELTYDRLEAAIGASRSIIAGGLKKLKEIQLIEDGDKRSQYRLLDYDLRRGWAKLPCRVLYRGKEIEFFHRCKFRMRAELDAMKLLLLFATFRDNDSNIAQISYDKIMERTGLGRSSIKAAINLLAVNALVFTEMLPSRKSDIGVSHGYRLAGIEPYVHQGTRGRALI